MTTAQLVAFEEDIAALFNAGKIRAPVHLSAGNEEILRGIFRDIQPEDWVCCSWRSHYHCLLKGVAPEVLKAAILEGRSIALCFPEHRIICSAIVGGILPIATGIALGLQRSKETGLVYCFAGDMTAETGIFYECAKYALNHQLPIRFIVEDNGKSVCTDTRSAWSQEPLTWETAPHKLVRYYRYQNKWPHAGAGVRVQF